MASYDSQKAIEHLRTKWKGRACPMCGVGGWTIQDSTFQLLEFNQGAMVIGGPVIPVVPVVCNNCGNTILINAISAGLVKPEVPAR